ncbi:MAG TPA: hypothetical protein VMU10_03495, partial [Desulfomonilia bacterium]|nr:hypothetical protein [Desulfomonilia bacterium]
MHDLYNAVWTNKTLNKFLPRLPRQAYLVGGCVRDLILGIDPSDYDIVFFGEPMILARQISDILGGKPFFIDENRQVARVAVDHGNLTIDVSPPRGENIEADLAERDITINAMACDPTDGALIDPTGGLEDLSERRIRLIAEKNLKDDPLRGLRCLRFSVQIGGSVDPGTMDLIRIHADSLHEAASERIKNEFFKALGHPVSSLFFKLLA